MSFIKLKRKCEDVPKEILVLSCKKNKLDNGETDASVFEFTGTISEEKDINDVIHKTIEGNRDVKTRTFNLEKIRSQLRSEQLQRTKLNRLKLQNYFRNVNGDQEEKDAVTVIDVLNDEKSSSEAEKSELCVYDIYYSEKSIDKDLLDDYSIHEVNDVWHNKDSDEEYVMEDEDDSNDENNWRNDYPDEEDEYEDADSNGENYFEYLSNKLKNSHLSGDSLSSDEFDEAISDDLFDTEHSRKSNSKTKDIDYYNEVASSEDSDSDYY